jgi:hypothetical protein
MTLPGLVRANNLSDVTDREKVWDNLGNNITTGNIAIPAPSFSVNFAANQSFIDEISGNNLFTFSRASTGTFVGSNGLVQTAASGVARFDHDGATGRSLGLLVEPERTNTMWPSIISAGYWTYTSITPTYNATTAPDGSNTATLLTANAGFSGFRAENALTHPAGPGMISFYAKSNGLGWVGIGSGLDFPFDFKYSNAAYNVLTGASRTSFLGSSGYKFNSAINVGNGWYRIFIEYYGSLPGGDWSFIGITTNTNGNIVDASVGNGTSGMYVWGVQFELGTFSTSYIPTTTSTVIRAADIVTISGENLSSFYSANAGTIYTEQPRQGSSAGVVIGDSAGNRLLDWQSSRIYRSSWAGTDYDWTGAPAVSATSLNRAALSYGQAARGAVNGTAYTLSPFVASGTFTTTSLTFQGVFSRIAFWNNPLTPSAVAAVTAISNTEVSYLADSYSTNFTITGGDVLALGEVRNTSTRDFVHIQGLTSTAQPRITAANTSTLAVVDLSNNGLLKLSPTSNGNYSFASGLTLSGVSLQINSTNALSIGTSPFSGSTATVPLLLSNLRPQANWRITEPMTSGTIASPSLAIPFEADDFVLFMKAGQS